MNKESLVEKVIYRLIRKHISGPTMGSAISTAKLFNQKGIPVSINFMSQSPQDKAKANYITTTYLQLIREISRMGIRASVHLRFEQLGSRLAGDYAIANLSQILEVSRRYGVFVWCELTDPVAESILLDKMGEKKSMGVAVNSIDEALSYVKKRKPIRELKVNCKQAHHEKSDLSPKIEQIASSAKSLVLHSPSESAMLGLMKREAKYRKSLILEFQLGYGEKKLTKMLKRGARLSVYIPFGKDWASYATTNVPEGYMRALAGRLLTENRKKGV